MKSKGFGAVIQNYGSESTESGFATLFFSGISSNLTSVFNKCLWCCQKSSIHVALFVFIYLWFYCPFFLSLGYFTPVSLNYKLKVTSSTLWTVVEILIYFQEARKQSIQRCIQSLVHACQCRDANCRLPSCHKVLKHFHSRLEKESPVSWEMNIRVALI
jgi:hypothetical protein